MDAQQAREAAAIECLSMDAYGAIANLKQLTTALLRLDVALRTAATTLINGEDRS